MISYKKIFHGICWLLFLSFLVVYFAQLGGYYESINHKKKALTEENIKQFEKDIKAGKKIDVENYIVKDKNYETALSTVGLYTSSTFAKYFKSAMNKIFGEVDKAVNDD